MVTSSVDEARGTDPRQRAAIVERIQPVGSVNIAGVPAAAAAVVAAAPRSGEEVAAIACNSCHIAGVLEAPKIGDTAAWGERLAAGGGVDGLTTSAISGKGNMPPRGGAQASDEEIRAAVVHLLEASGVDVGEAGVDSAQTSVEQAVEQVADAAQSMVTDAADAAAGMVAAATPAAAMPAAPTPAAPSVDLAKGKSVYDQACFVCHAAGVAGAPKLGDKGLWAPRIAKGMDALNQSSLNGIGAMPAKGGRLDLSDGDVMSAVAWMVEQAR
jgi:cytochrome c5